MFGWLFAFLALIWNVCIYMQRHIYERTYYIVAMTSFSNMRKTTPQTKYTNFLDSCTLQKPSNKLWIFDEQIARVHDEMSIFATVNQTRYIYIYDGIIRPSQC